LGLRKEGYHQFHAVNAAVEETVRASGMTETGSVLREEAGTHWAGRQRGGKPGDRRAGVVWHTQGSGKSFSMLFFAARVVRHPAMQNPTLVVLTDRNDLDDQLFGQFQRCADILGQTPIQAADRNQLRELLNRAPGSVRRRESTGRSPVISPLMSLVSRGTNFMRA
jgi:type I restriction enzyme, R subunit